MVTMLQSNESLRVLRNALVTKTCAEALYRKA
jgi:hypothetical protein